MCCPPVQFLDPTRSFCRFSSSLRGFFFEGYFGNLHAVRYQLSLWGGSCRKERKIKVMDHRPEKILCDCLLGPHGTVRGS